MSAPYIIWTLRRTGGTTLAALLASLSEHPKVPHEPFNPTRVFGAVTTGWRDGRDAARLRAGIAAALAPRPVIKHCFEIMPPELNRTLMEVATGLGYAHIILDRRAETERILSLALARNTGAWGGKDAGQIYARIEAGDLRLDPVDIGWAVTHLHHCRQRREEMREGLALAGQVPSVIYFEDLYGDPQVGRARVGALLDALGIDPGADPDYEARLTDALLHRGQNSARILAALPNIDAARRALEKAQAGQAEVFAAP